MSINRKRVVWKAQKELQIKIKMSKLGERGNLRTS